MIPGRKRDNPREIRDRPAMKTRLFCRNFLKGTCVTEGVAYLYRSLGNKGVTP
jgi:hypothetical protein